VKAALFMALTIFASQFAFAGGETADGATKSKPCAACHGADFNTPISADIPRLAGQHADYTARTLTDYKSGARKNALMAGQAAALSPQDIQDLAAYFQSLSGKLKIIPLHRLAGATH